MNATEHGKGLRKTSNSQLRRGDVGECEPRGADLAGEVGGRLAPELVEEGRFHGDRYLPCRGEEARAEKRQRSRVETDASADETAASPLSPATAAAGQQPLRTTSQANKRYRAGGAVGYGAQPNHRVTHAQAGAVRGSYEGEVDARSLVELNWWGEHRAVLLLRTAAL